MVMSTCISNEAMRLYIPWASIRSVYMMPSMWLSDTQKIGVAFCAGGGYASALTLDP